MYQTSFLPVIAWLRMKGFEWTGIVNTDVPGIVSFQFPDSNELQEAVEQFHSKQAVGELTGYLGILHEVRKAATLAAQGRDF